MICLRGVLLVVAAYVKCELCFGERQVFTLLQIARCELSLANHKHSQLKRDNALLHSVFKLFSPCFGIDISMTRAGITKEKRLACNDKNI